MTQDLIKQEDYIRKKLKEYLLGNEQAVEFCLMMLKTVHFWDDLADGEKLSPSDISDALIRMTFFIPLNPFYDTFKPQLIPLMVNTILCWQDANILDHGSEHDMHISYGLRSAGIQILVYSAFLLGGNEWAKKVGPDIRRLLIEDLNDFVSEMKNELPR